MNAVRRLRNWLAEGYSRIDRGSPYIEYLTIDGLAGLRLEDILSRYQVSESQD
jgi:hypothetical protein